MANNFHNHCLLCNSNALKNLVGYEKHNLVKCKNCGFVFIKKIPSLSELESHYSNYVYDREQYLSPLTVKSYEMLLDEFESYRHTNRMLDVGCGVGFFLEQAKKRGWEVFGTEYSAKAIEICKEKGINTVEGEVNSRAFHHHDFDVITSIEVLEHLNNPKKEIYEIKNLLRRGGLFYCTTPNFNSLLRLYLKDKYDIISYPEHLSYYTMKTLNKLLTDNGFIKIKLLSTGMSLSHFRTSLKLSDEYIMSENSSDETLRKEIDQKWYLQVAKIFANEFFTFSGTGMTLKGYFKKS